MEAELGLQRILNSVWTFRIISCL